MPEFFQVFEGTGDALKKLHLNEAGDPTADIMLYTKHRANIIATENCSYANGKLRADVTGGTPPYTYAWSNGSTQQIPTQLGSGNDSVVVTCRSSRVGVPSGRRPSTTRSSSGASISDCWVFTAVTVPSTPRAPPSAISAAR